MKNLFKSAISMLLIAVMAVTAMLAFVPAMEVSAITYIKDPSKANGSSYTQSEKLAQMLNSVFAGDIDIYTDSNAKNEVSMPLGYRMSMSTKFYIKSKTTGNNAAGWQCWAYANAVYNKLFNEWVGSGGSFSHSKTVISGGASKATYDMFKNAGVRCGAYMRTTTNKDGSYNGNGGHSLIILSYDSKSLTYIEGNGDGNGMVDMRIVTWDEFYNYTLGGKGRYICHVVQPTDEYYEKLYPTCNCEELNQYNSDGTCSKCGSAFDYKKTETSAKGIYATTQSISPSTTPYSATQDKNVTLKAGTGVEILAKCTNAFKNTWYKVSYNNGKTGYLHESKITLVAETILPSYLTVTLAKDSSVMSIPCSKKTISNAYSIVDLKKGATVEVVRMVENTANNYWYEVKTTDGKQGWMYTGDTKIKTLKEEGTGIITGNDVPATIPHGSRRVDFKIQTKNSNINAVTASIYNGNSTTGTPLFTKEMTIQSNYTNLYDSEIDHAMKFGSLTPGKQYTFIITAKLAYGYCDDSGDFKAHVYYVSRQWTFTVQGSSSTSCSHTYDNACDTSCNKCGATRSTTHNYEIKYNDNQHWEECTVCGAKKTAENHNWEFVRNDNGNIMASENVHYYGCPTCHKAKGEDHIFDNACDTICNICKGTRTTSHVYDNDCDTSCNVCDAKRMTDHKYDNTCDKDCNICGATRSAGHKYSNACDAICDSCGATRTVPDHVYDNACDTSCNSCGHFRPATHTYDNGCDKDCNVCAEVRPTTHKYDSNCDEVCNECGETRGGYHVYIDACDKDCNVCGKTRETTHSYEYKRDEDQHWQQCTVCGDKTEKSSHEMQIVDIAIDTENIHWYGCEICKYAVQEPHEFDHECDSKCNVCEYARETSHKYDNDCDTSCNNCNESREVTHTYDNECDEVCNICSKNRTVEHDYDNACDISCNLCEKTRSITHSFGEGVVTKEPTTESEGEKTFTCKVCGEEKREILAVLPSQDDGLSITTTIIIVAAIACIGTVGSIAIIKKKK